MPKITISAEANLRKVSSWEDACRVDYENVLYPWSADLPVCHQHKKFSIAGPLSEYYQYHNCWRLKLMDGRVAWRRLRRLHTISSFAVPCWLREADLYMFDIMVVQDRPVRSRIDRLIKRSGLELFFAPVTSAAAEVEALDLLDALQL